LAFPNLEPRTSNPSPDLFHLLTSARIHVLTKVNVFLSSTDLPTSLLPPFQSVAVYRRGSLNVSFCLKTCLFCRLGPSHRMGWVTDHRQIRTTVNAAYRRLRTWTQTPIKSGLSLYSIPYHLIS